MCNTQVTEKRLKPKELTCSLNARLGNSGLFVGGLGNKMRAKEHTQTTSGMPIIRAASSISIGVNSKNPRGKASKV